MLNLVVLACVLVACKDRPTPSAEARPETPPAQDLKGPFKKGDNIGVAAPTGASHADWVQPPKQLKWQKPSRARNSQEEVLYGTWVAKVGDYATRSAYMADRVMYTLDGAAPNGKPLVDRVTKAILDDNKLATACIWLELRPDFTGIRRECAIVNGEPSALDQTDFATGAKTDLGSPLEWFIDETDKNKLKIHFAADMVVPAVRDGRLRTLVFHTWTLQMTGNAPGNNTFTMAETFPEHDYTLPTQYAYQIASQSFLDQK